MSYAEYLQSDVWNSVKERYRSSGRPLVCAVCGSENIQFHHISYDGIPGKEELDDLLPLCPGHHNTIHKELDKQQKPVGETFSIIEKLKRKSSQLKIPPKEVELAEQISRCCEDVNVRAQSCLIRGCHKSHICMYFYDKRTDLQLPICYYLSTNNFKITNRPKEQLKSVEQLIDILCGYCI